MPDELQAKHHADSIEFARQWRPIEEAAQRAEARAEGLEVGVRRAVFAVCRVQGIVVPEGAEAAMAKMDAAGLERLLTAIETTRAWPR